MSRPLVTSVERTTTLVVVVVNVLSMLLNKSSLHPALHFLGDDIH